MVLDVLLTCLNKKELEVKMSEIMSIISSSIYIVGAIYFLIVMIKK